jgi:Pvc16 N-terminal domain
MAMLQSILDQLRARLNATLQASDPRSEDWVALTNPVDLDGRVSESARDKIVMTLVGLQSEPAVGLFPPAIPSSGVRVVPPLHLDVLVLFAANFTGSNYATGLQMIWQTMIYFHQNPLFTRAQLPSLPAGVDNVALDFVNLDLMLTNDLMAMLGLKYLPSVLYRMKNLALTSAVQRTVPIATGRPNASVIE